MNKKNYTLELDEPMTEEEDRWRWRQENRQEAENEITRRRAKARGLESRLYVNEYGWLGCDRGEMETIKLDDRINGNEIYLLHIPEINKWAVDIQWFAKKEFSGCSGYPSPLWSRLFNTRDDAVDAAWKCFERMGVKRPYIQGDLFGGDYS